MKKMLKYSIMMAILVAIIPNSTFADNIEKNEAEKNEFVEKHIQQLLEEEIKPENRTNHKDIKINAKEVIQQEQATREEQKENKAKLVKSEKGLDIVPIPNSNGEYLATAILNNTYEIPEKQNSRYSDTENHTKIFCDVKISYSAVYKESTVDYDGATEKRYKVSKYLGQYVKTYDSQMTCSQLKFRHHAVGRMYSTAYGDEILDESNYWEDDAVVDFPHKKTNYRYTINQPGYVSTPLGFSAGRLYVTIKRNGSGYTLNEFIGIDFGDMDDFF